MNTFPSQESIKKIFMEHGRPLHIDAGQPLLEKGSPANQLWFIVNGSIKAFCSNADGDMLTLFYIQNNNLIYVESLVSGMEVINDGEAVTPLDVLVLPSREFLQLWQKEGGEPEELMRHLIKRIMLYQDVICTSQYRSSKQKVTYFLYSQYHQNGKTVSYTQDQIAEVIGITRGSVNKVLNELADEGTISHGYKCISIENPKRLQERLNSLGYFL